MSIALMAAAWRLTIPMSEKMVLLCLADFANDDGVCWPAVLTIAAKCSCSDRTVQKAIKWLRENEFLSTIDVQGNAHRFALNPRKIFTPENSSPPKITTQTPENSSPKPLKNHHSIDIGSARAKLPKKARAKPTRKKAPASTIVIPDWIPTEQWEAFLEMRKGKGAKPTDHAINLLIGKLGDMRARGHDPGRVLDQSTLKNWTDIYELKEDQLAKPKQNIRAGIPSGDKRSSLKRAIDEAIANLDDSPQAGLHGDFPTLDGSFQARGSGR